VKSYSSLVVPHRERFVGKDAVPSTENGLRIKGIRESHPRTNIFLVGPDQRPAFERAGRSKDQRAGGCRIKIGHAVLPQFSSEETGFRESEETRLCKYYRFM